MTVRAMPLMLGALAVLTVAYRYYSAFLAARVAALDDARTTPAHSNYDGQNFHPTNRWVLFGHHFAAISGAGPLIGPVLAIQFGYMPGLIWLVVGVCLAGAVQDMMVLAASVRRGGQSLAGIARVEMGGAAGLAMPYLRGEELKRTGIWHTMSLAKRLGKRVLEARRKDDPAEAVLEVAGGKRLFGGKIVDVERRTTGGFARGKLTILGHGPFANRQMEIAFQNENLVASIGEGVVATVPDLICILEEGTGEPITTEVLRYGLRVVVLGLPADEKLRTEQALEVVGPRAFGYELPYRPL